jgi:hypothetical protein
MLSSAQDNEVKQEIEKVLEKYLNSVMSQVSTDYYDDTSDKNIDYNIFKSILKENMDRFFKKYVNASFSELQIYNIELKGNGAYVPFRFI